jgi:L-ribulose-5-phosphate 4-epimerase
MKKVQLFEALQLMAKRDDVIQDTHGNVSVRVDDETMYIKPSGVPYELIRPHDLCEVRFGGNGVHVSLHHSMKPSVDVPHHISIYQNNPHVGAICHTHSPYAVAFAMLEMGIPCVSTEQADYFGGSIRCLPYSDLNNWGKYVWPKESPDKTLRERAVLLGHHGVLTFAGNPVEAVNLAIQLENLARKHFLAQTLHHQEIPGLPQEEIDKWHQRYQNDYGQ